MRLAVLPGQVHDLAGMPGPLEGLRFGAPIGDGAFDADWPVEEVEKRGAIAVIPSRRNRRAPRDCDGEMYKWRHQTGSFFAGIGEFRAISTRRDKTDVGHAAAIHLVAGVMAAKQLSTGPRQSCESHADMPAQYNAENTRRDHCQENPLSRL